MKGTAMKTIMNKIISLAIVLLMAMPLTWQVFADDALPEGHEGANAAEMLQPEPEAAEAPAAPETEGPGAEETPSEPDEATQEELKEAPAALIKDAKENASVPAEKNITISGTSLDCTGDGSGEGWTYEKECGRIVLRDYSSGADITSDGTGVNIVSTGFNRIGTLSCDGDINLIGTGILLIDKVELTNGCTFNLLPLKEYYGEDGGSVAVFLKNEDGSYMLANGSSVKGIVDEEIEIPEDVKLVIPATSMLELQAYKVIVERDEGGNETIVRDFSGYSEEQLKAAEFRYYRGHLLTNDLIVEEGATIRNNELKNEIAASIIIGGNLINNGIISGGAATVFGNYSGTGTVKDSFITLRQGQSASMNLEDSTLSLDEYEYTLKKLNVTGSCELYYDKDLLIEDLKSSSGGSVDIYSKQKIEKSNICRLVGTVNGAAVSIISGIAELGTQLKLQNGGSVNNKTYGGIVFDYSGSGYVSDGTEESVFLGGNVTVPQRAIPVVSLTLNQTLDVRNNVIMNENPGEEDNYKKLDAFDASKGITYEDLIKTYCSEEQGTQSVDIISEVFSCDNNKLYMTVLGDSSQYEMQSMDPTGVFLIRMVYNSFWRNAVGGSTLSATRADQTGSGNIGGNSSSIITGTGITRYSSDGPATDPDKPGEPDSNKSADPAKAKPVKEYSVAAVTVSGDALAIQVNAFDLNTKDDKKAEKAQFYDLTAYINGAQISELNGPVKVEMEYTLPEQLRGKQLYAVFENEDETSDETFAAVRAEYDEETGTLTFETSQLGEFIITALEFDGEEFSPEFYDELEKTEIVKLFSEHLKEKKDNAGL